MTGRNECQRCHDVYRARPGDEGRPYCDVCAHERVEELEAEVRRLQSIALAHEDAVMDAVGECDLAWRARNEELHAENKRLREEIVRLRSTLAERDTALGVWAEESSRAWREVRKMLEDARAARDLVAILNGDGGHHQDSVGFVQACKDAEKCFHDLYKAHDKAAPRLLGR